MSDRSSAGEALACALQEALPVGSLVVVCWRSAYGRLSESFTPGVEAPLRADAGALLERDPPAVGASDDCGGDRIEAAWWLEDGSRAAIVACLPQDLPTPLRAAWLAMARRIVAADLSAVRAHARAEALEKSERLQQALYGIADLAGSGLEMTDLLSRIHGVVCGLMYAENFYIVLYDDVADTMRFLYFADRNDPYVADPQRVIRGDEMPTSLTLALLRHGEPLQGSSAALRDLLGVPPDEYHGPDSADWLGVPMRRDERVCGAIVVQNYESAGSYGEEDRALLSFVAQHILTALDRFGAREELERHVAERTYALQLSNRDLQAEIIERQRSERLQRALFRIAELTITSDTLGRFYSQVHDVVSELLYARNFYIALLSEDGDRLQFPYSIDERDMIRESRQLAGGLTEYVIRQGRPLLADRHRIAELNSRGEVRSHGSAAHCWLGVPLYRDDSVVGVIAIQSYSRAISFNARDQELLTFVAHHISIGLARKQAQDRLVTAHGELEQRVASRTRELAHTNAELLAQIGERVRAEQKLTHQALHDALTGLPNRGQLLERLDDAIARARREQRAFAVLFLDLDRFKLVNDSVGHSAGDELLVESSRRIVSTVRSNDTVARLGGDEFAILIENIDGLGVAEELASRVLRTLGEPCWVAGREVFPSASIGIAMWHPRYRNGIELLRDADAAMYRAKGAGRGRCAVFDEEMREQAMRILDLEADLRRAINGDAFIAYYQPIVRLDDHGLIGHEALLRWRHEKRGLLLPREFIGLGEDSGLIEEADWILYGRVVTELARGGDGYISVNVSPRHFRSGDFADRLLRMIDEAGADPRRLRIEITEVALLDDVPRALRMLRNLRNHGVLAQLDDFGTGFSALSYLHRFPIECLKIDQSFVAGLVGESRPESVAVVRAIQALAGTLGIHTIGEGVETEAQRTALRELGCTYGQGYLFGHPGEHIRSAASIAEGYRSGLLESDAVAAFADGSGLIELGADEAFPAEADPIDSDRVEAAAAKAASTLIR
ncbi:EAL domain-containing protein [Lysobacter antibioticus]|uniref:Diguanylate cyclase domain protein n=1 Tax=Lysobacter antibioticus TaxID=84531 RepID=A0A0S2FDE2_LYSAN|nr:EAL domain-containing protein [Lysobacter antibioticus]ALN81586.1 diguanylate cyclase domain protein [Lysobacter antibioticus]